MIRVPLAALLGTAPLVLPGAAQSVAGGNVLLLLADDIGVESIGAYGIGPTAPSTPNIDALAAQGVLFRNAWSNPVCSPTRALIQTGRYAFRTGVGHLVENHFDITPLLLSERLLPELLDEEDSGYAHAAIGKWHLGNPLSGGALSPNLAGYSHFAGTFANLPPGNYFQFTKVEDGVVSKFNGYATTDTVDEALAWIATAPEPWFCYVAFHAAHSPFHAPPASLHTVDLTGVPPPNVTPRPYFEAMVESLDTEIGRLLASLGDLVDRTTVVFAADNGTDRNVIEAPYVAAKAKGTVYEGGVRVPLIVSAPWIASPGRVSTPIVSLVDLFATVAELAGVSPVQTPPPTEVPVSFPYAAPPRFNAPLNGHPYRTNDSVSILPYLLSPTQPALRESVFAEYVFPQGSQLGPFPAPLRVDRALRGSRYKLVQHQDGSRGFGPPSLAHIDELELYDLVADPYETTDLLDLAPTPPVVAALDVLIARMTELLASK